MLTAVWLPPPSRGGVPRPQPWRPGRQARGPARVAQPGSSHTPFSLAGEDTPTCWSPAGGARTGSRRGLVRRSPLCARPGGRSCLLRWARGTAPAGLWKPAGVFKSGTAAVPERPHVAHHRWRRGRARRSTLARTLTPALGSEPLRGAWRRLPWPISATARLWCEVASRVCRWTHWTTKLGTA